MVSILAVFFQALARTEVQCIPALFQLMGKFGGNKHAAQGIASHLSGVLSGRGRRLRLPPRGANADARRTENRPETACHGPEEQREDYEFQNVDKKTAHNRSDGLSRRRDAQNR